ncbi:MAG: hypothetical protein EHM33_18685 [Chloroflexi bacterium]|nr:MAG: hypothetical protein EHM33_18685 [Chloroflexota bacterium]
MPPTTLKRLITSSILYMVFALIGAVIAIMENRPAEAGGFSTGLPVLQDFLYGNGTAMSPPLYMLIAQAVLTVLAPRRDRWGAAGVGGLTIAGLLFCIGALVEPILLEIFNPLTFDLFKAVIEAGLIIVPFVMMVFGIREWTRRRRDK